MDALARNCSTAQAAVVENSRPILAGGVCLRVYMNLVSLGVIVSLPVVIKGFDAMRLYPVVSVSYQAILAIVSLVGGRLGMFWGRKRTILAALAGIMLGSAVCALAPNLPMFLVGYLAFGFSYGVSLSMPISILCDISTHEQRPRYMGIYTAANNIGMLAGPFLGGFITDRLGFTFTPLYPLPLAIVTFVLLARFYPNRGKPAATERFDFPGLVFLALGVAPVVVGLNLGGRVLPWSSSPVLLMIAGGLTFCVLFLRHERRVRFPLLAVELFRLRSFAVGNAMLFLIVPYFTISSNYAMLFMQGGLGLSATVSGTLAIPKTLTVLLFAVLCERWIRTNRQAQKRLILLAGAAIGVAELVNVMAAGTAHVVGALYGFMVLLGVGELIYFMTLQPYLQSDVPDEDVHAAMSIQSFATVMGMCVMSAVCGVILNAGDGDILRSFPWMNLAAVCFSGLYLAVGALAFGRRRA